jgi:general secretion pathway protein C
VSEFGDPEYSLATLTANGDSRARLRRKGDRLGNRVVAWIGTDGSSHEPAVWLNDASTTQACRVNLFSPSRTAEPSKPTTPVTPEVAAPSLRDLLGPVRARPQLEAGKLVGLRLFGVRPSSLLSQIGLRNGDRIDSINGYSIAGPEQALIAYARLRTEEHFKLRVTRAGQPLDLDYRLTDSIHRELVKSGLPN